MRIKKNILISLLLVLVMILQINVVLGTDSMTLNLPNDVANSGSYLMVPIRFKGNPIPSSGEFSTFLRKFNDSSPNANERFDISGIATFKVQAYAYKTGDNIKLGTQIYCLGTDGNWINMGWRDREDQLSSSDLAKFLQTGNDLYIDITDIEFTLPNQNASERHVKFKMKASTGGEFERQSSQMIQFATKDQLNITRNVREVANAKNVWEVELKVEGTAKPVQQDTKIVVVLDRSASMNEAGQQDKIPICRPLIPLFHIHSSKCYSNNQTRAQLVNTASQTLVKSLASLNQTEVAVVSFGGTNSFTGKGAEHYKLETWEPFAQNNTDLNGYYSNYKVETDFTNNKNTLTTAVFNAMNNISGGTPMSLGLIKAATMLKDSDATNKIIILLSDGEPTYLRDGSGPGNRSYSYWNTKIDDDLKDASNQIKNQEGIKLYTIAAGRSIGASGIALLKECSSGNEYSYQADDTSIALDSVMNSISTVIINEIANGVQLSDTLTSNLTIVLPETNAVSQAKIVSHEQMDSEDWINTSALISQGQLKTVDSKHLLWDIGNLDATKPAIIRYRISLSAGKLGQEYFISGQSSLKYMNDTGDEQILSFPNSKIKASWAQIAVDSYTYLDGEIPSDNSHFIIWKKIPSNFVTPENPTASTLKIGIKSKFNTASAEIDSTGNTTIKDHALLSQSDTTHQNTQLVDVLVNTQNYGSVEATDNIPLTDVVTHLNLYFGDPTLNASIGTHYNLIQPQGISNIGADILFNTKSRDVSYTVDISDLANTTLNGNKLMNYNLLKASCTVKDLISDSSLDSNSYEITKTATQLTITFKNVIEQHSNYGISIYIPTTMGTNIVYGGPTNYTYLKHFLNTYGTVKASITTYPKLEETLLPSGKIDEIYSTLPLTTINNINMLYIEIATIN